LKKEKQPELEAVKKVFDFSDRKAKDALRVLSPEAIKDIVDTAERMENPK